MTTFLAVKFQCLLGNNDPAEQPHGFFDNTLQAQKFLKIIFKLFHLAPYDARSLKRELIANNLAYCREVFDKAPQRGLRASNWDSDIRSILRFIVATGCQGQIRLDQPDSIWSGQFSWEGDNRSFEDFSWLVDYLRLDLHTPDDNEVVTYILLVLSGMRQLGSSPEWKVAYVKQLLSFMESGQPRHVRYAALRAAHDARSALASIDISSEQERLPLILSEGPFNPKRDLCFLRLVFALAGNEIWIPYLVRNHFVEWCVTIIEEGLRWYLHPFYLIGFLLRIAPSKPKIPDEQWQKLMREAWHAAAVTNVLLVDDDSVEALRSLVGGTIQHLKDCRASKDILKRLDDHVASALMMLERRIQKQKDSDLERAYTLVKSEVVGLKREVCEALSK